MSEYTLHLGDCLEYMRGLPAGVFDACITDPPYSSGGMVRGDRTGKTSAKYQHGDTKSKGIEFAGDTRDQRSWITWCSIWMNHAKVRTKPGGVLVCFSDWRQLPSLTDAIQCGGWVWRGIAVWDKGGAIPQPNSFRAQCEFMAWGTHGGRIVDYQNGNYPPGLFQHRPPSDRSHITEKPVDLIAAILEITNPGDTIFDPFMGSGTTGVACMQLGRNFVGCEIDPEYYAIAEKRISEAAKQPPLFVADEPKETPVQKGLLDA